MKLTNVTIAFYPGHRPVVTCTFDQSLEQAQQQAVYEARHDRDSGIWVYRADVGDIVLTGAEMRTGKTKLRMVDGIHNTHNLQPTNQVAVNRMFPKEEPVTEIMVEGQQEHIGVIRLAQFLETYSPGYGIRMAIVEWPSGVQVYEPVQLVDGEPRVSREGDKLVYVDMAGLENNA